MAFSVVRPILLDRDPYGPQRERGWNKEGRWPAKWISPDFETDGPIVAAYSHRFELQTARTFTIHVSGDERYQLFLNGVRIGRGPERCDEDHWAFASFTLELGPGEYTLLAIVHSLGEAAPFAQHSVRHGFILASPEFPAIDTGTARWDCCLLGGYEFKPPQSAWGTGYRVRMDGSKLDLRASRGGTSGWKPAKAGPVGAIAGHSSELGPEHLLRPALLLPQTEAPISGIRVRHARAIPAGDTHPIPFRAADNDAALHAAASQWIAGETWKIPAGQRIRVLLDLDNYYCARPIIKTRGGAGGRVRVNWQEALFNKDEEMTKGNRDDIEGKHFSTLWSWSDGVGDDYLPSDGDCAFEPLWWHAGRYVEVVIETRDQPLELESPAFIETRYPLENESRFASSDATLDPIIPIAVRGLQMCAHETYFDCPYYEQLQYVGDTRLQALVTYAISPDDRLPRQALLAFDHSRRIEGLTMSRYPSRVRQVIPPFSLWFVTMVHDFMMWRDDRAFVAARMPAVRSVLDHFASFVRDDGLLEPPPGWNFVDWVDSWSSGEPPTARTSPVAPINLQLAHALRAAAELERYVGEPELAARWTRMEQGLLNEIHERFFIPERGLYADDLAHQHFSEHSQCLMAILDPERGKAIVDELFRADDLAEATIYFSHYVFEAARVMGRTDEIHPRLDLWRGLVANGLRTTVEKPEPTRSDCHAWGAHPLFHFHATFAGIRPAEPGFRKVRIQPQLGPLTFVESEIPHPSGRIKARIDRVGGGYRIQATLPTGVTGEAVANGRTVPLISGEQTVVID